MNRACFPKEKTPEFTKKGEIHELFVLALSLVWFAGATPDISENDVFKRRSSETPSFPEDLGAPNPTSLLRGPRRPLPRKLGTMPEKEFPGPGLGAKS